MEIPILYEDDQFFIINKPSGIVVNRAESVKGETVQDWIEQKDKRQTEKGKRADEDFYNRSGIVHRIDKETSGILLIAKTPKAFAELQRQFKERAVKKTYLAIVHGKLVPEEGEIRAPVGRLPWSQERFGILPGGKDAVTRYKVISTFPVAHNSGNPKDSRNLLLTLVELYPETGRTHQIRVHLKYINHPIVGDYLYAGRKTSRDDRTWALRVMLHAWKIECIHPISGNHLAFEAQIPDDMKRIIQFSN